jgi:hyperosmotically inducible periplasmic protein
MNAKRGVLTASAVCVALLGAGCNNTDDTVARSDLRGSPPSISPVAPPAGPANNAAARPSVVMDDTVLTAKVKAALIAEPGLRSTPIEVSTRQSIVTLSGSVGSVAEKAAALQIAETVEGVKDVIDKLVVKA